MFNFCSHIFFPVEISMKYVTVLFEFLLIYINYRISIIVLFNTKYTVPWISNTNQKSFIIFSSSFLQARLAHFSVMDQNELDALEVYTHNNLILVRVI